MHVLGRQGGDVAHLEAREKTELSWWRRGEGTRVLGNTRVADRSVKVCAYVTVKVFVSSREMKFMK